MSALLVIAGPSGSGKSMLVKRLLARDPHLWFSVSVNTRPRRSGEVEGRDYLFTSRDEFERTRAAGGFLESSDVYGDLKGTPRTPIEERRAAGQDVLVEVDVQGALAIRALVPDALLVFVVPPSRGAQRERLLARAETEADRFDAVIVNDDLDRATEELVALLERRRRGGSSPRPTWGATGPAGTPC